MHTLDPYLVWRSLSAFEITSACILFCELRDNLPVQGYSHHFLMAHDLLYKFTNCDSIHFVVRFKSPRRSRCTCAQVFSRKTMDLHGLHVSEAVEVLETEIRALSARGAESVRVLTGTGHHSKGPSNKVR